MIQNINQVLYSSPQTINNKPHTMPKLFFKGQLNKDVFVRSSAINFEGKKEREMADKTISYYDQNAVDYCQTTQNLKGMDEVYKPFLELLPPGAKILDAGCGSGRDSKNFIDNGYKVTAFDASKELAKEASKFLGQDVLPLKFNEISFKDEFDGVWACASLLHVPKDDFEDSLGHLVDSLKDGGVLYASVKQGEGESVDSKGRFFSYYTEDEIKDIVNKRGDLQIEKTWINGDTLNRQGTIWMNLLLRKVPKAE
ncbi:MAG: class I SAM-dependent methyltransferase [Cyanobacteriota bacterium]